MQYMTGRSSRRWQAQTPSVSTLETAERLWPNNKEIKEVQ